MKNLRRVILSISVVVIGCIFTGCRTSRVEQKVDSSQESIYKTIVYLQKNPDDSRSAKALKKAYQSAQKKYLGIVHANSLTDSPFKSEADILTYVKLNALYDSISRCNVCTKAVQPTNYETQESTLRQMAAQARNSEGERLLATGIKTDAKVAFQHFTKANQISPGFGEAGEKLKKAFDQASTKVLIDSIIMEPNNYGITEAQLNSRIQAVVDSCQKINRFLQFFVKLDPDQIIPEPDEILVLKIYSFVVEKPKLTSNTANIADTISGKMIHYLKTIASEGIMEIQIRDFDTKRIVLTDRLSSEHKWVCEWWVCSGNPVGLTTEQLANCKSQEIAPPDPAQLFKEFSTPLYDQVARRLKNFYSSY